MKFTDGYWNIKPGMLINNAVQIREVRISKTCVRLYVVNYGANQRGMDGPVLEMFITSPLPNIIRTEVYHFMGSNEKEPKFEIANEKCELEVIEEEKGFSIISGDTKLVVAKNPVKMEYYYKDRFLTRVGNRFGKAILSCVRTEHGNYMRGQLDVDLDEYVYGMGERFVPFVRNGQVIDIWNEDGGTGSEISYKNIPFYITNKGYGVFVNSSDKVSYEVCSEAVTKVQFSVPGEKLDFMLIGAPDMKGVLESYTSLTGKPGLPPAWSFGLWLTSSFTTSYDEKTVLSFVDGMRERKIPLHVFHFDCYWMKENEWCSFEWNPDTFGDIDNFLKLLKEEYRLKICVWINSYIAQKSPLFKEAKDLGYLLLKPNGDVWQSDKWQAGMGIVDFTNPGAYKWYQDKLRELLKQGVDTFKTDFGERIPTEVVYYNGNNAEKMHNYYTYLYNKCVYELLEEVRGKNEACLFARSATAGGQKFPVHWGGDCSSSFISMSESIRGGLSLCMSGFGFWSHDISGFEGTAPAEVYKRWVAFGLLSTHSRLHGANSYRVPWLFGEEAVDVLRFFTNLKCKLMPYIFDASVYAHDIGIPVMRAMVLEFEKDLNCTHLDRQYMLGKSILVAPVFKENGDVNYYLPKGRWTHILSNKVIETDGSWQYENHDYMSLPLLARENSIIAIGNNDQEADYDYADGLTLHVFELSDEASATVYDTKAECVFTATGINKEGRVTMLFEGKATNLKIVLRNVNNISNLIGATICKTDLGIELKVNNEQNVSFNIEQ
ncbi:alpha-xylosidase [Candidatus Epulonipiscioides saccharophilum]|nr:alpha-xylosidase [Epulopiscium sp. SCG-B10WGA-EpuloB]